VRETITPHEKDSRRSVLEPQIERLEKAILVQGKLKPEFQTLQTIRGVGEILAISS
jgi:hypothetical protein